MAVKVDETGRRSISVEVDVPGTPEEVWATIATGPGVTCWFVPTQIEEAVGGKVTANFGPGMDSHATVTAWEPPHRFAADSQMMPGMPTMATEWIIEGKGGGVSTVRVVHSLFASTDEWDDQLTSVEAGWPTFFRVLRTYLENYAGQVGTQAAAVSMANGSLEDTWSEISGAFGLGSAKAGDEVRSLEGAPRLSGELQYIGSEPHARCAVVHITEPAPGSAIVGTYACGGPMMVCLTLYLYGEAGKAAAETEASRWQEWLAEKFPAPKATNA